MEKRVNYIPAVRSFRQKKVGIYCRVSTNDMEQLNSLTNQISALTRLVSTVDEWKLVDCYIDIASAKKKSPRTNFERMLDDSKNKKLDMVITKSVSRFGRDTVDTLQALNVMKECEVRVIFEQESLDTKDVESSLMISIIESLAQAENEARSENIKWGIKQAAASGASKLYDRKCYGYKYNGERKLIIDEETAENVKIIFDLYLRGQSVLGIVKELEKRKILSPTGKVKWCKRTIDVMLSNEKYTGNVQLLKSSKSDVHYLSSDNNPVIISNEIFEDVQIEKERRSNMVKDENGRQRKCKKYSSMRDD